MRTVTRPIALVAATALVIASLTSVAPTGVAQAKGIKTATTSRTERSRVDAVKTPRLHWYSCYTEYRCGTVRVPLDYDEPDGAQVELALLKVPAGDPKRRVGTLFVNPGGPGASGTELAFYARANFSERLLERFDVVGFDPRGVGYSTNVVCSVDNEQNEAVLNIISATPFPDTRRENRDFVRAYNMHAKACSSTGLPLTGAISTAQVARDMDVLRRAVGDRQLNYLGFSYGSYLGQVYSNLFPDRVRAVALDGVLDPRTWAGTPGTAAIPLGQRMRSAEGAAKALHEILVRCDRAGGRACPFAPGDPVKNWRLIADRLKADPLELDGRPYGYPEFAGESMSALYYDDGADLIARLGANLIIATEPPARLGKATAAARKAAMNSLIVLRKKIAALTRHSSPFGKRFGRSSLGFPYDNSLDVFQTIACTDSLDTPNLTDFPALAAAADRRTPYFGALWLWNMGSCASPFWTVNDEDAYRGRFDRRTANPLLVVGNFWDPATNYSGAVASSELLGSSRLLSSDSWGHTAYGTSDCVTQAIDRYLIRRVLPQRGTVCVGDRQPFDGSSQTDGASLQRHIQAPVKPGRT